jgi:hypothetical protein
MVERPIYIVLVSLTFRISTPRGVYIYIGCVITQKKKPPEIDPRSWGRTWYRQSATDPRANAGTHTADRGPWYVVENSTGRRQMASFLTRNPGATAGPAGVVHSVNLSEYLVNKGPLTDEDKARLLINMHDYWFTPKVDRDLVVREIQRQRYFIDQDRRSAIPGRVFKMLKKEHADWLCERGCLGLGPLNYYTTLENEKIADRHEGLFITYADGFRYSIATITGAGSHVLVYCTTTDTDAEFGYDACVEITQPEAFSQVVAGAVAERFKGRNELVRVEHSKYVYQHSRVIAGRLQGFSEELIHLGELSVDTIDVLSDKKYLIKESTHATEAEYRFAIVMRTDVSDYTVIECPQAARFCRRVR